MKIPTRMFGNCRKSITDSTESENKLTSVAADPTAFRSGGEWCGGNDRDGVGVDRCFKQGRRRSMQGCQSVVKFKNSMVHYNNNLLLILFSFFFFFFLWVS